MLKTPRYVAFGLLCLAIIGCGQAPPTPPAPVKPPVALTPTPPTDAADTKPAPAQNTAVATPPVTPTPVAEAKSKSAASFPEAKFLGEDVVALVVVHPRRLSESALYKKLGAAGLLKDFEEQIAQFNVKPELIERATLVIDQTLVNKAAGSAGLEVPEGDAPPAEVTGLDVRNHLKQVGLAMHNYHDTYFRFPRADGDGEGTKTGLSWRVHVLPYIGEAELYDEFHHDEPWDSEHNKTLIAKMPALYEGPNMNEPGKTSLHVFVGEKTPFHGDKGLGLREFTDGSSNTILAVMAGDDTADIWTKPGGLTFDAAAPKKALGNVGKKVQILLADGSVHKVSMEIPDEDFANLVQLADGNPVPLSAFVEPPDSGPVPTVILSLVNGVDRQTIIDTVASGAEEEAYEGQTLHKNDSTAVCFFDDKTALLGSAEAVKKLIDAGKAGGASDLSVVRHIAADADFAVAIDLKPQTSLLEQAAQLNPVLSMLQQINGVSLQVNVTGKPGDKLIELVATAVNPQTAAAITELATGGVMQVKTLMQLAPAMDDPKEKRMQEFVRKVGQSANVQQVAERIEFLIPVPEEFDQLTEILKPAIDKATKAAEQAKKTNNLKFIGLACHNYNDVFSAFPGAGQSADGKKGLSWRVHILPFLDHAELYNKFKMDEPWDSETNKALINQMPEIYKTDGVTEVGKSAIHVFTGPGAMFAGDQAPKFATITDGSSNTILAVSAGPDTAEIWTKPGGLDFDPENPIKALGKVGEKFFVLFADGSVRAVSVTIKPETLRRLIQSADGEPITDEF